eukprot:GHVP01038202.1.p1 GENE.GHVP01038202.1~~GHVP01038202.1.p1  ORF type:complete len:116 (+),score=16.04 GHVP01038202.1:110-457(+)
MSKSVLEGSFFSGSHMQIASTIRIVYHWSPGDFQNRIQRETNLAGPIVVDECNFLREVYAEFLAKGQQDVIGGLGSEGKTKVDEIYHFNRKSNKGAYRGGQWVLGGLSEEVGSVL